MEVRNAMFSMSGGKAPGPDGFTADFFKKNWPIVGPLVTEAVLDFFKNGKLLHEINCTILALVPKIPNASSVNDFRPIACCNTVYKCITKIIANRIAKVLPSIINPCQNAFIKGRRITDNILLAQELFSGFHLPTYSPKCAIKVDFRKAYDTVDWQFLESSLRAFNFPDHLIRLIMVCVSTPRFSVSINREIHGFFNSGRGLRQGDPMSPYLFTMVMEVLSGILEAQSRQPKFRFYWRCKNTQLSHLFFADDVFIFSEANDRSVACMQEGLLRFSNWSGLWPNNSKSEVFLSSVQVSTRDAILRRLNFREGSLPVKYLGVPIITARLTKTDCNALVNLLTSRIRSWNLRFLSFAGRLLLIKSVLHAIQVYWAAIFWLPSSVVSKIEQLCRQFLWKGPALGLGGAKVSWEDVCLPKKEGGLGIRRIRENNVAAMYKHIWFLFTDKESLWCIWVHSNHLKNSHFWTTKAPTFCSWAWRKLLQLREAALSFFRWKIGNGQTVSLWFDPWLASGLLSRRYSHADIYRLPLHCDAKVADLFSNEGTSIREELQAVQDPLPVISDSPDSFQWIPQNSGLFSISSAWNVLRRQGRLVPWPSFIWDKAIIPRYQFLLWIISRNRLPTQTFLISIGRLPSGTCVFCKACPDSIKHLFFECAIPNSLATLWAFKCNIPWSNRPWLQMIQWLTDQLSLTNFHSDITKFSFAALCYVIWKTRNNMLF